MNISFRQLRIFLELFETGSFTAAAARLHVTQSAASKMIAELESQLNLVLFDRTTRRVTPNDAAREFHAFAVDVVATMQTATRSVEELISLDRGKVSIAASPLMIYGLLAQVIADYRTRHPGIQFELHELSTDDTVESVRAGTVDFGLGAIDMRIPGIQSEVVLEDGMYVVVNPGHPLIRRASVALDELAAWNHISLRNFYSVRRSLDLILAHRGVTLPSAIEAGTLTAALGLVRCGAGLLIVPGYAAAIAEQWGMHTIAIAGVSPTVHQISLIQRSRARPSVSTRHFLEVLRPTLDARRATQLDGVQIKRKSRNKGHSRD
ncbi:LysR family transcriptional regulator [Achromobacter seleniivolatilans]|uniref:LysR family transcriptional regulator n=1 Tax=Achromobacter seleniivolatilans TaxID=3047478 RepID=A0ABY9LWP6_9BURK|nr:LysR family transcriptional regulator [Achromobacter sp. R39]WMD18634.1 LysR family transcriptional regulator [Achromobacter sp. R39]